MKKLQRWWQAEQSRRFLWLPVGFAMGIAMYFALPTEPKLSWFASLDAVVILAVMLLRRWHALRPLLLMLLMIVVGFSWAGMKTHWQSMVAIDRAYPPQQVTGTVHDLQRIHGGFRVTLDDVLLEDVDADDTPARIRLTVRPKRDSVFEFPPIGSKVTLMAGLLPPMGPGLPGAFDFERYFYFNHIGAIGFGLPPLKLLSREMPEDAGFFERIKSNFGTWRIALSDRIIHQLGPRTGPVAAGFITGDARAISNDDFEIWRASNLYHIIAISGEHMMVISGVIFLLLRWFTLCLPSRIRYLPEMKTWAALLTLILVTIYLFVTGLPVSAIRAYVMIALVLMAILFRRQVNAIRSLFIAGFVMLVYQPADLFDPGFQLSFSATLAIIAFVEALRLQAQPADGASRWHTTRKGLLAVVTVSLVAELATLPFVLSQFNTVAAYGIVANTIATPLVSFFLMPLVALFFLLLPLGLSDIALTLMDYGIRALYALAAEVSSWPHALWAFPSPPEWAMAVFSLGLVWICIWQQRPRYLALPLMLLALLSPLVVRSPDMLIGAQLKQIAFRSGDDYVLARGRTSSLLPKLWANGVGFVEFTPPDDVAWRCDGFGCVASVGAYRVAFPNDAMALADDCALADVIVTILAPIQCDGKRVIDGDALRLGGIHALWFERDGIRILASRDWRKQRPWVANEVAEED